MPSLKNEYNSKKNNPHIKIYAFNIRSTGKLVLLKLTGEKYRQYRLVTRENRSIEYLLIILIFD